MATTYSEMNQLMLLLRLQAVIDCALLWLPLYTLQFYQQKFYLYASDRFMIVRTLTISSIYATRCWQIARSDQKRSMQALCHVTKQLLD